MSIPLDLRAHLVVSFGDDHMVVYAECDHITLELPSLRTGTALVQQFQARRARVGFLQQVHAGLRCAALNVDIRVAGTLIARLGAPARSGFVSRCLGLGPVKLHFWRLMWAWWKQGE